MIRTQIYLPEEVHETLLHLAQQQGTSISRLIRAGAVAVIKEYQGRFSPKKKALVFFANPSEKYRIHLAKSASRLVREDRD